MKCIQYIRSSETRTERRIDSVLRTSAPCAMVNVRECASTDTEFVCRVFMLYDVNVAVTFAISSLILFGSDQCSDHITWSLRTTVF